MKSKFYTRTGDRGKSGFGKIKLSKSDTVFEALGSLDELNAVIGFCRLEANKKFKNMAKVLLEIQETLFLIQAEIASISFKFNIPRRIDGSKVLLLERAIEKYSEKLPPITKFQIPGGSELSARLEIARTVTRRAERVIAGFNNKVFLPEPIKYLNRLSSLLFVISIYVNRKLKVKEENPRY
jgi:cob(I)alamin adenosyltransferase